METVNMGAVQNAPQCPFDSGLLKAAKAAFLANSAWKGIYDKPEAREHYKALLSDRKEV